MSELYRLVYASKNLLEMSQAEEAAAIAQILGTSRHNNAMNGVTGALLFNGGAFAQVLEGPRRTVESTFERIQRDERHGEVTVLQCGPVEARSFADWSMGFVGRSARGQALWSNLATESGFDLSRLDGDAVFAMLHTLVLDDEGVPAAPDATPVVDAPSVIGQRLDVERVRAELPRPGQTQQGNRDVGTDCPAGAFAPSQAGIDRSPTGMALAVLRDALTAERQRTTDLRNVVDALHVELATSRERSDHLLRERDLWVRRAQLLAAALGQEATANGAGSEHSAGLGALTEGTALAMVNGSQAA